MTSEKWCGRCLKTPAWACRECYERACDKAFERGYNFGKDRAQREAQEKEGAGLVRHKEPGVR